MKLTQLTEQKERPYICFHVKKGKYETHATSSYDAAKNAAKHWGLKSTAGINAHLAEGNYPEPRKMQVTQADKYNNTEAWKRFKAGDPRYEWKSPIDKDDKLASLRVIDPNNRRHDDTLNEYSPKQIRMAFGILNDPRYRDGNYDGAYAAIEKLAKGLASHPSVAKALKRANESIVKEEDKDGDGKEDLKGFDAKTSYTLKALQAKYPHADNLMSALMAQSDETNKRQDDGDKKRDALDKLHNKNIDTIEQKLYDVIKKNNLTEEKEKSIVNEIDPSRSPWTQSGKHPGAMNQRELEREIAVFDELRDRGDHLSPRELAQEDSLYHYLESSRQRSIGEMQAKDMQKQANRIMEKAKWKLQKREGIEDIAKAHTKKHTLPRLDTERYQERDGLEGPIMTKSGKVVYYDPKEDLYYDPDKDMYIDATDYDRYADNYDYHNRVTEKGPGYKKNAKKKKWGKSPGHPSGEGKPSKDEIHNAQHSAWDKYPDEKPWNHIDIRF